MRARVVVWQVVVVVVAAGAVTGCGDDADDDAGGQRPGDATTLVGESDQGRRVRVELDDAGEVHLRFPADCASEEGPDAEITTSLSRHPLAARVDEDGGFSVDDEYVEEGTDGDEEHVEVDLEGVFAEDGTASGTFEVTSRQWNGQGQDFSPPCTTGTVGWTADQPPVEGENVVVDLPAMPLTVAPAGDGLVATLENGDLVRIDPATGEAERLDGSPVAAPTTTSPQPGVPPTVVGEHVGGSGTAAGPAMTPPTMWLEPPVVVDGGVWTADPATGTLTRFALDDGAATATIDQPIVQVVAGAGALWTLWTVPPGEEWHLEKRDPTTGDVLVSVPAQHGRIIAGSDEVWFEGGSLAGGRLHPVDLTTVALGEPFDVDIPLSEDLVTGPDRLWWLGRGHVTTLDLTTGRPRDIDVPGFPDALGGRVDGDADRIWVTDDDEAVARRIEGDELTLLVDVPEGYWRPTVAADGSVWLTGSGEDAQHPQAIRLDPAVTGVTGVTGG